MSDFGDPPVSPSSPPPPPPQYGAPPTPPQYGSPTQYGAPQYGAPPQYGGPQYGTPNPAWNAGVGAPRVAVPRRAVPVQAILLLVGGAMVAIGSFLTWFTVEDTTFNGFGGTGSDDVRDGPFFLTFGLILVAAGVILLVLRKVLGVAIAAIVVAALTVVFALADLGDVGDVRDQAKFFDLSFSVGPGLYLCVIGAAVALGGAIAATAARRR